MPCSLGSKLISAAISLCEYQIGQYKSSTVSVKMDKIIWDTPETSEFRSSVDGIFFFFSGEVRHSQIHTSHSSFTYDNLWTGTMN